MARTERISVYITPETKAALDEYCTGGYTLFDDEPVAVTVSTAVETALRKFLDDKVSSFRQFGKPALDRKTIKALDNTLAIAADHPKVWEDWINDQGEPWPYELASHIYDDSLRTAQLKRVKSADPRSTAAKNRSIRIVQEEE